MAEVPAHYIKNKEIDFDGEIFSSMGLPVKFAGLSLLPPPIGVFSLLEIIESVFIQDFDKSEGMDCYRAFYIAYYRKKAACEVREWLDEGGLKDAKSKQKKPLLKWDKKVVKFAKKHELDLWEFARLKNFLLAVTFNGYEMIPSSGGSGGSYFFGADTLAAIFRLAGPAANFDYDKIIWDLPLCLVGHLAAIEAKANGTKGVGRPKDLNDMKVQFKLANEREEKGELHPWQKAEPGVYRPTKKQIKANPEINKEFNTCMKEFLKKQRKEKAAKEAAAKEAAA